MLKEDANNQLHYNGNNWAYQIKNMFQQHGLGFVWEEQSVTEIPFLAVKQRINDKKFKVALSRFRTSSHSLRNRNWSI